MELCRRSLRDGGLRAAHDPAVRGQRWLRRTDVVDDPSQHAHPAAPSGQGLRRRRAVPVVRELRDPPFYRARHGRAAGLRKGALVARPGRAAPRRRRYPTTPGDALDRALRETAAPPCVVWRAAPLFRDDRLALSRLRVLPQTAACAHLLRHSARRHALQPLLLERVLAEKTLADLRQYPVRR